MTLAIDIFLLILIIIASCLCIFLIIYLKKYIDQVEAVRKDFHQLIENTIPILNNLEEVTGGLNRMASNLEEYWEGIDHSIRSLRSMVSVFTSWKLIRFVKEHTSGFIRKIRSITAGQLF